MLLGFRHCLCDSAPKFTRTIVNKTAFRPIPGRRVYPPMPVDPESKSMSVDTPHDFLSAIGRSCEEKIETTSWEEFWKTSGQDMRKAGLAVKDRRYILWCMEKYRLGYDPREFAYDPKPKKTVRGWGPAVQNGKRIRSRRLKD